MSIIVALQTEAHGVMVCDTQAHDSSGTFRVPTKIFPVGPLLVGVTGWSCFNLWAAAAQGLKIPEPYVVRQAACLLGENLRAFCEENKILRSDPENRYPVELLLCAPRYLAIIGSEGIPVEIDAYTTPFRAAGSGAPWAIGALEAMTTPWTYPRQDAGSFAPVEVMLEVATQAARISTRYDPHSGGPLRRYVVRPQERGYFVAELLAEVVR